MDWANLGGQKFSFGNLSGLQSGLYEDKPDLAYQAFTDWFGKNNPAFSNSVFGRYLNQQQNDYYNRFVQQQAANPTAGLTWTKYLENLANSGQAQQDYAALPAYMQNSNPGLFRVRRELW